MAGRKVLPASFYDRDTTTVARELIGCRLVHIVDGQRVSGRIVETEAYLGLDDPACHSFGDRRTRRTRSMYLQGGHAYVYLIYGMHLCFNVVTRSCDDPEAVLIRALEPLEGIELMRKHRDKVKKDRDLCNGPGKLCAALGISRDCDGVFLDRESALFIEQDQFNSKIIIEASSRIGIAYAEEATHWPLRFSVRESNFVSPHKLTQSK